MVEYLYLFVNGDKWVTDKPPTPFESLMSVRFFDPEFLRDVAHGIFTAFGAPAAEAAIVADHLVEASLMGMESHGVTRILQYTQEFKAGRVKPAAPITVDNETPTSAIVDAHLNFGQVGAHKLTDVAIAKAREHGMSVVTSRNFPHTGRLGAYTTKVAEAEMIGIATIAVPVLPSLGHFVVPFGGREGRLATNPVSWAAPGTDRPVVLDMSTATMAEGKIRAAHAAGQALPPGNVIDAQGRAITDPKDFYGPPRGNILPLGGDLGYKGFGLGILTALLGSALGGENLTEVSEHHNNMAMIAISAASFPDPENFRQRVQENMDYLRSSPAAEGFDEVLIPGEPEFRKYEERSRTGIPLPEKTTWAEICMIAHEFGVSTSIP